MPIFVRYLSVSLVALALDYSLLVVLVSTTAMHSAVAAAAAYGAGALLHYALSRRLVFPKGWLNRIPVSEFMAFVATGLAGMLITAAIVHAVRDVAAMPLELAKAAAVAVSFFATYLMRKKAVFRGAS